MTARKTANSTSSTPKTRKARAVVEKVFVVGAGAGRRLVAGATQRKVEAAVWQKPLVTLASPADIRELHARGVTIEAIEPATPPAQSRADAAQAPAGNSAVDGAGEGAQA